MSVDNVVDVVSVRNTFVSALSAVHVFGIMTATSMVRGALTGVARIYRQRALINVAIMDMMQVAIMDVVDMLSVLYGCMATTFTVLVLVAFMGFAAHLNVSLLAIAKNCDFETDFHFRFRL